MSIDAELRKSVSGVRICICTPDYMHLVNNGGIGTSFQHSISLLAPLGAEITVLYANRIDHLSDDQLARATELTKQDGATLEFLFDKDYEKLSSLIYPNDIFTITSYLAYQRLKDTSYDVIIFADWRGVGYFTVHAKSQQIAFPKTAIWVQAHSTSLWHELNNQYTDYDENSVRVYHMERKTIELCDKLLCATNYLSAWMIDHGFKFPKDAKTFPLLINESLLSKPSLLLKPSSDRGDGIVYPKEIVFFGRLEKRKGLHLFIEALNRLQRYHSDVFAQVAHKITFIGKIQTVDGQSSVRYIERGLEKLNIHANILPSLSSTEALDYLKNRNCLAIIPSLTDNSPLTVHECIGAGIPFIACHTGGIPELVAEQDHKRVLVQPFGPPLADAIASVFKSGQRRVQSAIDQLGANLPCWAAALAEARRLPDPVSRSEEDPLLSVCITHYERPALLDKTLRGLQKQTYKNFEVVIIDNDSPSADTRSHLESLPQRFPDLNIKQAALPDLYAGAARNKALSLSTGEYVIFMDDDNYAHPTQFETFLRAITRSGFDALSCALVVFDGEDDPENLDRFVHLYIPCGSGLALNLFGNSYGDANGIYRRSALESVGGYTEDRLSWEDYELFSRLELAGFRVGVVPELLMYLRANLGSVSRSGSSLSNYYRALRPALASFPWGSFGDALLVAISTRLRIASNIRFDTDGVKDDFRLIYNSENPLVVGRIMIRRDEDINGFPFALGQLQRLAAASKMTKSFNHDYVFSAVYNVLICETGERIQSDYLIDEREEIVAAIKSRDAMRLYDICNRRDLSGTAIDGKYLCGLALVLAGDVFAGLGIWSEMLDEEERTYLRKAPDVETARSGGHIRSGLAHFLSAGFTEGRPFGYALPLRSPLSLTSELSIRDFEDRLELATRSGSRAGSQFLTELIAELVHNGSVIACCELSRVALSRCDEVYAADHPDVAAGLVSGQVGSARQHWQDYGTLEDGRFHLVGSIDHFKLSERIFSAFLKKELDRKSRTHSYQKVLQGRLFS